MLIRGSDNRVVELRVFPKDVWELVKKKVMMFLPGDFIDKGNWVVDHGGHGSGVKEVIKAATPRDIELMAALKLIEEKFLEEPHK